MNTITKPASTNAAGVVKRTNAYFIDPTTIARRVGWNPRFDFGDIEELAKSIRENGMLTPIRVRRGGEKIFELIDGDRRLTAIEILIKEGHSFEGGIQAIIEDKTTSDLELLVHMFEANTGKPFLPMEEAAAYRKMKELGLTLKEIAHRVGHAHVHIVDTMRLLDADPEVQEAVRTGKIGSTMGKQIAKAKKEDQKELVTKAKSATGKTARKVLKKEVEAKRDNKKASTVAKIKPLDFDDLTAIHKEASLRLAELLMAQGVKANQVQAMISDSDELLLAFHYGLSLGLKGALGHKIKTDL